VRKLESRFSSIDVGLILSIVIGFIVLAFGFFVFWTVASTIEDPELNNTNISKVIDNMSPITDIIGVIVIIGGIMLVVGLVYYLIGGLEVIRENMEEKREERRIERELKWEEHKQEKTKEKPKKKKSKGIKVWGDE